MADSFRTRLDDFGRRHPRLMLAATIAMAILTTLILLVNSEDQAILYKAF